MDTSISIVGYLKIICLPPSIHLILLLSSTLITIIKKFLGIILLLLSIAFTYFCATYKCSNLLLSIINTYPVIENIQETIKTLPKNAKPVIIVLGSGIKYTKEYEGGKSIALNSLIRTRYAAKLFRETGYNIIVSAGSTEATLMKETLEKEFSVPTNKIILENKSTNTYENALNSKELIIKNKFTHSFCVTNFWHMERTIYSFNKVEIETIAAPTWDLIKNNSNIHSLWLPSLNAYQATNRAIYEIFGLLWYHIKY